MKVSCIIHYTKCYLWLDTVTAFDAVLRYMSKEMEGGKKFKNKIHIIIFSWSSSLYEADDDPYLYHN